MKPTLGRIIHVSVNGRWRAAIVTAEEGFEGFYDQTFAASVFDPHGGMATTRLSFGNEGFEWRWPPKV